MKIETKQKISRVVTSLITLILASYIIWIFNHWLFDGQKALIFGLSGIIYLNLQMLIYVLDRKKDSRIHRGKEG